MKNNLFSKTHKGYDWDLALDLTISSMNEYGKRHKTWCIAWSGGKDSTAVTTVILYLLSTGKIVSPEKIIVVLADTRLELPPLWASAMLLKEQIESIGIQVEIVMADLEKRFIPYILGRGVPPSNNKTFRWCTRQIKIDPMQSFVDNIFESEKDQFLMITGVRKGESAVRDQRIIMSCTKGDGECGQGWYQSSLKNCATLAPIIHWKLCHVWDWLKYLAPLKKYGGWKTQLLAEAYGHSQDTENDARTGCIGCPLANNDTALDNVLKIYSQWAYLKPLKQIRPLWRELRKAQYRHRKVGLQTNKNGKLAKNQNRMGPLTMEARKMGLKKLLEIQKAVNDHSGEMPKIDLVNKEELDFIHYCWKNNIYPNEWTGEEPTGDKPFIQYYNNGSSQHSLFNKL